MILNIKLIGLATFAALPIGLYIARTAGFALAGAVLLLWLYNLSYDFLYPSFIRFMDMYYIEYDTGWKFYALIGGFLVFLYFSIMIFLKILKIRKIKDENKK